MAFSPLGGVVTINLLGKQRDIIDPEAGALVVGA
jgi:hypothetical protein